MQAHRAEGICGRLEFFPKLGLSASERLFDLLELALRMVSPEIVFWCLEDEARIGHTSGETFCWAISMYPKLWALSGISSTELVTRLIELALRRSHDRAALRRSLTSTGG